MSRQLTLPVNGKVVLYQRCSTEHDSADTTSKQKTEMMDWCNTNGYEVIGSFSDLCSGFKQSYDCRDGLRQAMEMAQREHAKVACVELSRLTRRITDTIELMDSDEVEIIFTRHNGRKMNRMELYFTAVANQMSSESTSRRVSAGIQTLFQQDPTARDRWGRAGDPNSSNDMTRGRVAKADRFALANGAMATELWRSGKRYSWIAGMYSDAEIKTSRGKTRWSAEQIKNLIQRYIRLTDEI